MNAPHPYSAQDPPARAVHAPTIARLSHAVARALRQATFGAGILALSAAAASAWSGSDEAIILQSPVIASTVPANGDLNPYGIAFVPGGVPPWSTLKAGDVVVSNFNGKANLQGTGTTIVKLVPGAGNTPVTFFQGSNLGLTTALAVLRSGFVLVGNLPTTDGTTNTLMPPGSLLVINPQGRLIATLASKTLLDGPWDLTVIDHGRRVTAFVSNVLNGTVSRIELKIDDDGVAMLSNSLVIASGYTFRTDPAALVVGPTGLAYDRDRDVLYVASTGDNAVFAIPNAASTSRTGGVGRMIYSDSVHLHGPLALALAPNGHLFTANGDAVNPDPQQPSEIVEFTVDGQFISQMQVDSVSGSAFGLAFGRGSRGQSEFAAVDDNTNSATIWTLRPQDSH